MGGGVFVTNKQTNKPRKTKQLKGLNREYKLKGESIKGKFKNWAMGVQSRVFRLDIWARTCEEVWTYPVHRVDQKEKASWKYSQKQREQNVEGTLKTGLKNHSFCFWTELPWERFVCKCVT